MNTINEEARKKMEELYPLPTDDSYPPEASRLNKSCRAAFCRGYESRDAEVERLRKELNNALSVKVNEQAIKQIVNRPGIVSKICANEIRKNETLESELAALKKQVEEMDEFIVEHLEYIIKGQNKATYITDKQI